MTQATDIHIDPSCSQMMDPDMVLGSSFCPDNVLALGISKGHSDLIVLVAACHQIPTRPQVAALNPVFLVTFGGNMALRLQHEPQLQ